MNIQTVQAYKCRYCSKISLNQSEIENHEKTCRNNPDYIQKCIQCSCLNEDFILTNIRGKGICLHTGPYGSQCPYLNHDDTDVQQKIQESRDSYIKFSSYSSNISPQENREKEEKYDYLRNKGYTTEKAMAEVYGNKTKI